MRVFGAPVQILAGLVVSVAVPIATIWLASSLSSGCHEAVSWFAGLPLMPVFCSAANPSLVYLLTLPTFALGLVSIARRAKAFGATVIFVGLLVWIAVISITLPIAL